MKILILTRRFRSYQSEADEHDFYLNKKILEKLQIDYKLTSIKIDLALNYEKYLNWRPDFVIFLGFDPINLKIKNSFLNSKFALWAKCYSSSKKNEFKKFYEELDFIFDSCYLNILKEKKNYFYLPTAIHDNFKYKFFKQIYLSCYQKTLLNQVNKVDVIFSGSPRFNRKDNYRQNLINLLIKRDIKVLICAPKKLWKKSNFNIDKNFEKNLFFSNHNYWATSEIYEKSKFVLDLPWLDTIIPELEEKFDPQFALGWNVFRSGFHGSNLISYDCDMNRNIGLNETNCSFYKSSINDLPKLADEIEQIIKNVDKKKIEYKKLKIKKNFTENHTYFHRWNFIISKLSIN